MTLLTKLKMINGARGKILYKIIFQQLNQTNFIIYGVYSTMKLMIKHDSTNVSKNK